MRLFTVSEANNLLATVRPILLKIQSRHRLVASLGDSAKAAAKAAQLGGGGMDGGAHYVESLYEISRLTLELDTLGIQLKDYSRGLIDFPAMRDGEIVLLCWQLGEGDEIAWWHGLKTGFAGRKPL